MPTATWPMPDHESSQIPSAWSARSYQGIEHRAKPSAATRCRPRWVQHALFDQPNAHADRPRGERMRASGPVERDVRHWE
jgi:hypothetical protein